MITIRPIRYLDILDAPNAEELFADYAAESSIPEIGEISPQRKIYETLAASGMLRCFGSFMDGVLVGFATSLFYTLPHYGTKHATVESFFVTRKHRSSIAGRGLMDAIESCAKKEGCKAIQYSAPTGSKLEKILDMRQPYRRTNAIFTRSLA